MSDQANELNKFARDKLGAKADAAAGQSMAAAILGDQGEGAPKRPDQVYLRLPTAGGGMQLTEFAREMGRVMSGNGVFVRNRAPVTIDHDTGDFLELTPERFRTYAEKLVVTYKFKVTADGSNRIPETMNVEQARGTLSADVFIDQQRSLDRVNFVRMPVKRKNGAIELLPEGYDEETRIFTLRGGPEIDESMDLEKARAIIDDILGEFPWGDWEDGKSRSKAVAVAFMLTMYCLGLQEPDADRMNLVVVSNSPRSGKSLLVKVILTPIFGAAEGQARPDREEMRKVLDACALNGSPYLFLDNLKGNLDDANLEAFMTTSVWSGRLMGTQRKFSAPRTAVVFVTGNNLSLSTDLAGRTLLCELYVEESDPQARSVKRVINNTWLGRQEVRRDMMSALWAIVRHWDKSGRPGAEHMDELRRVLVPLHRSIAAALRSFLRRVRPKLAGLSPTDQDQVWRREVESLFRGLTASRFAPVDVAA